MQRIGIGINENVMISKAFVNDKKRLAIELAPAAAAEEKKSIFDESLTAGVQNEPSGNMLLSILGPLVSKKEDQTTEQRIDLAAGDVRRLRNQLIQILEQYMLREKIDLNAAGVQYAATGITDDVSYRERILQQDVLDRIYDNVVKRFIELITPFLGDPGYAVRFKLMRQSKDKHYATIPSRWIADQPFIELMSVPKEQSRVKFSQYEIDNGLDSAAPIQAADKAEAKVAAAPDANPFAPPTMATA